MSGTGLRSAPAEAVRMVAPAGEIPSRPLDLRRIDELVDASVEQMVPSQTPGVEDRRTRNRLRTKRSLLKAGWRLFLTVGFEATTIQDITDAADVGKSTFFAHFDNKGDVALHLCTYRADKIVEQYERGDFEGPLPSRRILRFARAYASMNAQEDPEARTMNKLVLHQFFAQPMIMAPETPRLEAILQELVEQGVQAGEFSASTDPAAAAQLLYAALYSTKAAWLRPPASTVPFDLVARSVAVVEVVVRGLAPPAPRPHG